jgi:hypothetical protein
MATCKAMISTYAEFVAVIGQIISQKGVHSKEKEDKKMKGLGGVISPPTHSVLAPNQLGNNLLYLALTTT